ncbi:MAG TPA: hypothetical protein VJ521_01160, partial [Acidobacteriota bacterium]|nr:hypothetical protein [Acidobacteriota bacterium]
MSFPEYLKGRISEDYKNLIIQKLQEIKQQTDQLKSAIPPSMAEIHNNLRESVERELTRISQMLNAESESLQRQIQERLSKALEEYTEAWYHSDITAYDRQLEILLSDIISHLPPPPKKASPELQSVVQLMHEVDRGKTQ